MPNWCEGSLKVRGSRENVQKFIDETFKLHDYRDGNKLIPHEEWLQQNEEDWFYTDNPNATDTYVEGTKRAFVDLYSLETFIADGDPAIFACPVKQAWAFHPEEWCELSKKYSVDFYLYGIESGMMFMQEYEIVDGKIIYENSIGPEAFNWKCPFPWMGG